MEPNSAHCQEALLLHLDGLYGYAMTLSQNPTAAEDLVQETFTRAALHLAGLKEESNLKGWLFTIMRNLWLKELRHVRNGPTFVALDDVGTARWAFDSSNDPEVLYVRIWERDEIRTAIERLSEAHREVIVLCDIEGFSYKEMAELLDCPVGTIMSRLARARAKLKQVLVARQDCSFKSVPGGS